MQLGDFDFHHYLRYARLWVLIAVLPAILAGLLGYERTAREAKTYDASVSLYVQQPTQSVVGISGVPDLSASSQLAQTYSQLAIQPIVAQAADKILWKHYPAYRVEDHALRSEGTSLQQQQQLSPLIVLTVTDTVPKRAADAANAVGAAFISRVNASNASRFAADQHSLAVQIKHERALADKINAKIAAYRGPSGGLEALKTAYAAYSSTYQSLVSSAEQLKLQRDISSSAVDIYSPAVPPTSPTGPHPRNTAILWAFFVLMAGSALVYGYQYLSDLCGDAEEASQLVGAPVLGAIPAFRVRRKRQPLLTDGHLQVQDAEGYRMIRTNIQFANVDRPPRTLLVTSSLPGEGKTTTASNLALTFAEGGRSVTLIDGDLRRPSLHKIFEMPSDPGLTGLILNERLNGHRAGLALRDNLNVLPSGPLPPNPSDLLGSDRMAELMTYLKQQSDMVIVDAPPVLAASDAAILSTIVDGVILVIDLNSTKRREIRHTREAVEAVGGKIIGVVINRVKSRERTYYYSSKYYTLPKDDNATAETVAQTSR